MKVSLLNQWIKKEKRVALNLKRKYLHFDWKINFEEKLEKLIHDFSNSEKMSIHSFLPFISTIIKTPRYKKEKTIEGAWVRKKDIKKRPISYASHYDALIYSWYTTVLNEIYSNQLNEFKIKECVLAYLSTGKSNIHHALEIFNFIKQKGECVALAMDLSSFFDTLDHEILKSMWLKVVKKAENNSQIDRLPKDHYNIFKSLTNYSTVDKLDLEEVLSKERYFGRYCSIEELRKLVVPFGIIKKNPNVNKVDGSNRSNMQCGIPQGAPISAVLSNIYMIAFDQELNEVANKNAGLYRRYCDDIIMVCKSQNLKEIQAEILKNVAANELILNHDKTEIIHFVKSGTGEIIAKNNEDKIQNLQYLGFEFSGENIYIRNSSISKYHRKLKASIRKNVKAAKANKTNREKVIIFKKSILDRYTARGNRNFVSYASRAKKIMNSPSIRRQYGNTIKNVLNKINNEQQLIDQTQTKALQ